MDTVETSRHAARAAVLSLLPGLGHLYIGERQGFSLIAGSLFVLMMAWSLGWPVIVLYFAYVLVTARDVYLIVTRDRGMFQ